MPAPLKPARLDVLSMRRFARAATSHDSVRLCGSARKDVAQVELWAGEGGRVQISGVNHCGSPWECTDCAPTIGRRRAELLDELARRHRARGGEIYHVTLTVPHDAGMPLKELRRHVSDAWRFCLSGAPWIRLKDRAGVVGFARALDVTVGRNGWHPHLHVLVFLRGPIGPRPMAELRRWLRTRWTRAVQRPAKGLGAGLKSPARLGGVGVKLVRAVMARYLAEASIALGPELASHTMKQARAPGHWTPWQLLHQLAVGEWRTPGARRQATARWHEWAAAMRGARQLTFSRDLRAAYDLHEVEDAAALREQLTLDLGEKPRRRITVAAWEWGNVVLKNDALYAALLDLAADAEVPDADAQETAEALVAAAMPPPRVYDEAA